MGKKRKTVAREIVVALIQGLGVPVLLLAATHPAVDLSAISRWAVGVGALAMFVWFGLPWVVVGLTYLVMHKIGKAEDWMRERLVTAAYPRSHYLRTMLDPRYRGETYYAATAFVVSKSQEGKFLWIRHRTHNKRLLPPGGRLLVNELPHEAVIEKVFEETAVPKKSLVHRHA